MPSKPSILMETEVAETRHFDMAGGDIVAYTARAPDKLTVNEDTVGVLRVGDNAAVLALADGAGGMPAGKKASQTAVETFLYSVAASEEETLLGAVMRSIEKANQAVLSMLNGSATTLTIVTIEDNRVRTFQVGDSEALVTGQRGKLKLYTIPHSPTGLAVEAGYLDEEVALYHPDRHLVSNFVGSMDMTIDVGGELILSPLDTLVIASDGLTDNLFRHEVIDMVRTGPLDAALECLTAVANGRMRDAATGLPSKPDDLSIILYRKHKKARNRS